MGKVKQWKNGGSEDKFITKLIRIGKINKFTKPAMLKADFPAVFGEFSPNVIRNHLNLGKRKNGLYLDGQSDGEEDEDVHIQEVSEQSSDVNTSTTCGSITTFHHNYPVLCETYKEPDNQIEKVVMAVSLPGGVDNLEVDLSDDGTTAVIKYSWPKAMYDMEELFKKPLANNNIQIHHPKILSLRNGLEKMRERVDIAPTCEVKVTLPIKVQTSLDSWTKSGVTREDGTKMIVADLKGYIKDYNKKLIDSKVNFDM